MVDIYLFTNDEGIDSTTTQQDFEMKKYPSGLEKNLIFNAQVSSDVIDEKKQH
jgi:hypothetical protein